MPADHSAAGLCAELANRFDTELASALRGARQVALLNFPNHGNPGDDAIWLGARASLRRLGISVRYQCAWTGYHPDALAAAHPEGPVLLNGGGNFGDLYGGQQGLRERVFRELRGRPVIQLPQSIHFAQRKNLDRVRRQVAEHGDVTLMLREQASYELAQREFEADTVLAPDSALALGSLAAPAREPRERPALAAPAARRPRVRRPRAAGHRPLGHRGGVAQARHA